MVIQQMVRPDCLEGWGTENKVLSYTVCICILWIYFLRLNGCRKHFL